MMGLLSLLPGYYYIISLVLQAICVIHCLRAGNQSRWIYIIVFLPFIGCIAYIFSEILTADKLSGIGSGMGNIFFNPAARIRRMEHDLKFADTFNNRVMLADAYMQAGRTEDAIALYQSSLTGAFDENEHVILQLIEAYSRTKQYDKVVALAKKIYTRPQFLRSRQHIRYAQALYYSGDLQGAEREYKKMKGRFADFEARYQYGLFLQENGRGEEARVVFEDIAGEAPHLSSRERRSYRTWIIKAKEELKR